MASFIDNCGFIPTAGGTSDWTYASTAGGYQSPTAAGAVNGAVYVFRAQSTDLTQWEYAQGAYNSGTGTFARTTVLYNSSGTTSKIGFTTSPGLVAIVALAQDVSRTLRTRTTLTSGSGTYTTPVGCRAIDVFGLGGGAGGQGNSAAGAIVTTATAGAATTVGASLTANGGPINNTNNYPPVAGGTASGGDYNVQGAAGAGGQQLGTAGGQVPGGAGASSPFGSGGQSLIGTGGTAALNPGSGGGGAGASTTSGQVSGSGGSAGGHFKKLIVGPSATYAYAVGAGGNAGTGTTQNGGAGAAGIIIVDEYY
jgi:hypothetical protein